MTAPQRSSGVSAYAGNRLDAAPVVPAVPASMLAYLAQRSADHRADQEAVASDLVKSLITVWPLQDFDNLNQSTPLWLGSAMPHVQEAYYQSQRLQAIYTNDVRMASDPDAAPLAMAIPEVSLPDNVIHVNFNRDLIPGVSTDPEQPVVTFDSFNYADAVMSLTITGNYNVKAQMPGQEAELMANGRTNSAGAAVRHAMNGGRNVTNNVLQMDRKVIGYARVTDSDPCHFCALLASRGAVYGTGSFVDANKRFKQNPNGVRDLPATWIPCRTHDHCRCFLRPVYSTSTAMDAAARFYKDQWDAVTKEWYWLPNHKQIDKFRDQYVPYDQPAPEIHEVRKELEDRVSSLASAGAAPFSPQIEWANQQLSQLA